MSIGPITPSPERPGLRVVGPVRYAAERQRVILAAARADGRVEVTELAQRLHVTGETIRRDLTVLERRGLVRRVHGGALPVDPASVATVPPVIGAPIDEYAAQKGRIARRALEELPDGGTILIDGGTTTRAFAEALPEALPGALPEGLPHGGRLTVVTNNLAVASIVFAKGGYDLFVLGGRIRHPAGDAVGVWATEALADVCVDVAFLGTNGFSVDRGLTTPHESEVVAKRAFVACAPRVVVLADSTKAGAVTFHRFASLDEVDLLVTDTDLDDESAAEFDAVGLDVVRA